MVATNFEAHQEIVNLITITVPGRLPYRFHNGSPGDYFYEGQLYTWINFEGGLGSVRSLGLGGSGGTVRLANRDAKVDSLKPIRDWLNQDNGWRKANVEVLMIWPNDLSAVPILERHQVLSSSIQGGETTLTLKGAADAINATVPSMLLTSAIAPELPNTSPGSFG
jgi:hypothetical protein